MTIATAASKGLLSPQTMARRKGRQLSHRMVWIAALATCSTSTHAWAPAARTDRSFSLQNSQIGPTPLKTVSLSTTPGTRLYSSSKNQLQRKNDDSNELFGFRRGLKSVARKVLPTKWFGTQKEREALERKQIVKDRVRGELDEMLRGAPLPIQIFGKYVAAPMMGKIASRVAEAGFQQQEAMEAIMDQARDLLLKDPEITGVLGTPIQIGAPFSQRTSTTVINGSRQMRTEFEVELSGPYQNGVGRIIATNEGIGQLLVESNGKIYNVDLTSEGSMSFSRSSRSSSTSNGNGDDDTIIEAEIIDKKETTTRTKR